MLIDAEIDFYKLLSAIADTSAVNYTKLQHPKNRTKKYHIEDLANSVEIFFNPEYLFEHLKSPPYFEERMSGSEFLTLVNNGSKPDYQSIQQTVVSNAVDYWWKKKFHSLPIIKVFSVCGYVWTSHESSSSKIDFLTRKIYHKKNDDKFFYTSILDIFEYYLKLELTKNQNKLLKKHFYLFLKINSAFDEKNK